MSETLTIDLEGIATADEARRMLSLMLYHEGRVSLARAGKLAGVPLADWLIWAGRHGVVLWGDDYDLEAEMKLFAAAR